ncbi:alpha/beta hydrolase [Neobacillus muris]|uniref:alpha/beta hydrolase n=1 Tax=Neobacillus muris TaxID=2941334 RepID=UPI0020409646|nr:alpha/beta fold hydrolase [Neobacillus muris]
MIGCLCLHGFTGAPYEVEPLVTYLQERTDWVFRVPTLPGHGETLSLKGIRYQQWMDSAEEELKGLMEICDKVYVIGFSMGGMIASFLAASYQVDKLVLLSAAAYYIHPRQLAEDVRKIMKDLIGGQLAENKLFFRYRKKVIETPMSAVFEFRKLVSSVKPLLPIISSPVFIAQGESDGIVPPKSAEYLYRTIGSNKKELSFIRNSKHHICYCDEKEVLFSRVFKFLQKD